MASLWQNFLSLFESSGAESEVVKESNESSGYPNTYRPKSDSDLNTPEIFDPALSHYPRAFRHGDPIFETPELNQKWHESRNLVIDRLLSIINTSERRDNLVLRGSLLLKTWLGEQAREPGDIDWVFRPASVGPTDATVTEMFSRLVQKVTENPNIDGVTIDDKNIQLDDIWTYERAAGKRIVFPWAVEGLPPGEVQMDIVFHETLWSNPIQLDVPTSRGRRQSVWAVNQELSLAWKLLWLETDFHPQGKDLYDAALLAEQTGLSLSLLMKVLEAGDWRSNETLKPDFPLRWEVDWENFKLEYPWVVGEAEEWQKRLTTALTTTFTKNH